MKYNMKSIIFLNLKQQQTLLNLFCENTSGHKNFRLVKFKKVLWKQSELCINEKFYYR